MDTQSTEQKILGFAKLPSGWHYGSGITPRVETIAQAKLVVFLYGSLGLSKTDAFPGIDGEIMVTAYEGDHYIEITLEGNNFASNRFVYEYPGKDDIYEENMAYYQVIDRLLIIGPKIKSRPWRSSESSTQGTILTLTDESSRTSPFAPNAMHLGMQPFLALTTIARSDVAEASAPTLTNTISSWQQNRQFTGSLSPADSQQAAA